MNIEKKIKKGNKIMKSAVSQNEAIEKLKKLGAKKVEIYTWDANQRYAHVLFDIVFHTVFWCDEEYED